MEKRNDRKRSAKAQKRLHGKCGFTLAELLVTMGLLTILTAMIVSFSVLISDRVGAGSTAVDRIEECERIKEAISSYIAQNDLNLPEQKVVFFNKITPDGSGTFTLPDDTKIEKLSSVESIAADQSGNGKLIKFTITFHRTDKEMENEITPAPYVFVFAVRYAGIYVEGGDAS